MIASSQSLSRATTQNLHWYSDRSLTLSGLDSSVTVSGQPKSLRV